MDYDSKINFWLEICTMTRNMDYDLKFWLETRSLDSKFETWCLEILNLELDKIRYPLMGLMILKLKSFAGHLGQQ